MRDFFRMPRQAKLLRYSVASVVALAADAGTFWLLLQLGQIAAAASAVSYSLGIVVHWLFSSRMVFNDRVATTALARTRQQALFLISALAGLALTTALVAIGDRGGANPMAAKATAIVASFALTWLLRSRIVFGTQS